MARDSALSISVDAGEHGITIAVRRAVRADVKQLAFLPSFGWPVIRRPMREYGASWFLTLRLAGSPAEEFRAGEANHEKDPAHSVGEPIIPMSRVDRLRDLLAPQQLDALLISKAENQIGRAHV